MSKNPFRPCEVRVGETHRMGDFIVKVLGPLYRDDNGDRTTPSEGSHIVPRWWVTTGPNGPMRVPTRHLYLTDKPSTGSGGRGDGNG